MFEMLSRLGIPLDGNVSEVEQDVDVIHTWLKRNRKPGKPARKAARPSTSRAR